MLAVPSTSCTSAGRKRSHSAPDSIPAKTARNRARPSVTQRLTFVQGADVTRGVALPPLAVPVAGER